MTADGEKTVALIIMMTMVAAIIMSKGLYESDNQKSHL